MHIRPDVLPVADVYPVLDLLPSESGPTCIASTGVVLGMLIIAESSSSHGLLAFACLSVPILCA